MSNLTKLIRTGEEELVSLPPEVRFGKDVELIVTRSGDTITLVPAQPLEERPSIQAMVAELRRLPRPSEVEVREPIEFPERPGL